MPMIRKSKRAHKNVLYMVIVECMNEISEVRVNFHFTRSTILMTLSIRGISLYP